MDRFKNILSMKYSGKVIALIYGAIQAGVSFLILKFSVELVTQNVVNMSITYAVLALLLGVMSMGKDHISVYVDVTSPYHKERLAHEDTKVILEKVQEELEEKKDYIHSIKSSLNNTFITCKTGTSKLDNIEKILTYLNKDSRLANCGNSKLSQKIGGDLLAALMITDV